jgi:nifR3 family TIM-barrel protein
MFSLGTTQLTGNLLLAPLAGYCDLAFRLAIRPLGGVGLAYTDLISPRGLLSQKGKSMELIDTAPADRPLAVQLYGHEPELMADAARWCADHLELVAIDINMGCPVDKVCKKNGGAALLKNPELALRMAEQVVRAVDLPVTAKMRLGWDADNIVAPQLAAALENVGIAAITVHGRTAVQMFRGEADQTGIARVVETVRRVPVIGNGDVKSPQDVVAMMQRTGCAGVMIGRAALANPWIFRDTQAYLGEHHKPPQDDRLEAGPTKSRTLSTGTIPPPMPMAERVEFIRAHFENQLRLRGERRAIIAFRRWVTYYGKMLGARPRWRERFRQVSSADQFTKVMAEWMREQQGTEYHE